ncbi:predicted protein [Thalassiosira pseudonana CCMP1335]|uniref:AB hydrolase-1 domain-containing protein n=1 Tax=Thalassiosira pseudonana TaxID=35128 RepID=B8LCS3_THAPS|nr:predicted protein [Thalassiosira pseudonana CCMP1335]EED86951.1 predicted protein [Thalassiosira pseudonana CCMP1335]
MIRRPIQKSLLHIGEGNRGVHASYLQTSLSTSSVALSPRAPTPRRQHAPYASVGLAGSTRAFSAQSQPKLAYEWIVDGKLIPQSKVDVEEVGDKEVILFLHGLLGNAKNLRTPAKKLTEQIPINALLLDVRGHANSTNSSSSKFAPPHDFQACVSDIFNTLHTLGFVGDRSPTAVCGHSLGGRIALEYVHRLCGRDDDNRGGGGDDATTIQPPKQIWILDSVPGQAHPSVHNVLNTISSLSLPISSKNWLTKTLIEEHGMDKGVAMWMASNLKQCVGKEKGFEWIFDLEIANELVDNFTDQDFVQMIQDVTTIAPPPSKQSTIHLVKAGKNKEWTPQINSNLQSIPSYQNNAPESTFQMHTLEKAGHWVHVDDCEGLVSLMADGLRRRRRR